MNKQIIKLVSTGCFGLLLAASASAETLRGQALADGAQSAPYQKPGAPVMVAGKSVYRARVGEESTVTLKLKLAPGSTSIRINNDEGLVVSGPGAWETDALQFDEPIVVTPLVAQKAYVHVFVEHIAPTGNKTTRALAIAIDSRTAQQAALKTEAVKPFVEMQAAETIY